MKKGVTVKIDADLHAEVKAYIEQNNMTMADFVSLALQDELHPKIQQSEENSMERMRTMAVQVPESLFQKIKDYLHRNNLSQKDFVIGLIETEIERDLAERQAKAAVNEQTEDADEELTEETSITDEDLPPELDDEDDITEDDETENEDFEEDEDLDDEESEDEEFTEDEEAEDEEETEGFEMSM